MKKSFIILIVMLVLLTMAVTVVGKTQIKMWYHSGRAEERAVYEKYVTDFNASQDMIEVIPVQIPEGDYANQVNAAALAGKLPDVLELDGPFVGNYAWAGYVIPLDNYMSMEMKNDFLPSIIAQGHYMDNIYALGSFDSGLAIWGNKKYLNEIGARIPESVDDAWTMIEFMDILRKLKALPEVTYPLDFKINYGVGEWYTYGFSPIWQAFGADLINRTDYLSADGILNGPEAIAAASWFQSLFAQGFVNANPAGDAEFINGEAALSWVGHWVANQYKEVFGDDLVLIPMPKMFKQATGMGSWAWSISADSKYPAEAWEFLNFILEPDNILKMVNENGAVPARISAYNMDPRYAPGGFLNIYVQQLEKIAVERPVTPAYPVITTVFMRTLDNIIKGADVREELDKAVKEINQDIEDNDGYKF